MSMFDMMGMLGKMKEVQSRMKEAQEKIGRITETGDAGAGMVKVIANGKRQLVSIEIDEDLFKGNDRQMVADLIVAAANKALERIEERSKSELQKSTEGLLPNIPGMDLGNIFGKETA